jgi:uncharacterized membrane protein (TIGR02234 family)
MSEHRGTPPRPATPAEPAAAQPAAPPAAPAPSAAPNPPSVRAKPAVPAGPAGTAGARASTPPRIPDEPAAVAERGGGARPGPARREMAVVVALWLAGAAVALFAASRAWLRLAAPRNPPLPPVEVSLAGGDLEPVVPALAVVGLAAVVALLATRGWARLAVGVLVTAAGLALALRGLAHARPPGEELARQLLVDRGEGGGVPPDAVVSATAVPAWPVLAALGGLALLAGGILTILRGRLWPAMSARYERPGAAPAEDADEDRAWDALDRGEDPTAR